MRHPFSWERNFERHEKETNKYIDERECGLHLASYMIPGWYFLQSNTVKISKFPDLDLG